MIRKNKELNKSIKTAIILFTLINLILLVQNLNITSNIEEVSNSSVKQVSTTISYNKNAFDDIRLVLNNLKSKDIKNLILENSRMSFQIKEEAFQAMFEEISKIIKILNINYELENNYMLIEGELF